ncbi:hypothetical protein ANN_13803 [Periplaneta americana]|uniref:Uncharacterized protein n=1 Tax=Periplaneta americana TaxID=6978 RepID=A0ABQ8SUJ6_PERAM|nr:hypothetical protein ANN_13803 [Periplaneta americana]
MVGLCEGGNEPSGSLKAIFLHTSTPIYLASRFSYLSSYHNLFICTQNSRILAIPTHKTSSYSSSYTISPSRLWNTLPSDIRDYRKLVTFKSKLIQAFSYCVEYSASSYDERVVSYDDAEYLHGNIICTSYPGDVGGLMRMRVLRTLPYMPQSADYF